MDQTFSGFAPCVAIGETGFFSIFSAQRQKSNTYLKAVIGYLARCSVFHNRARPFSTSMKNGKMS